MNAKQIEAGLMPPLLKSVDDITDQLTDALLSEICTLGGIPEDRQSIRRPLAKQIWQFQRALADGPVENLDPQRKEVENLHRAIKRTLSALDALNAANHSEIDYEIKYRPPFNDRFNFPQQQAYWEANDRSVDRAKSKLKMISWAAKRVSEINERELSYGRRTQNTHLDHFILQLACDYERWSTKPALSQCYFSARADGYAGQFYDFTCKILDTFTQRSYHSKGALGKRIVRLLRAESK